MTTSDCIVKETSTAEQFIQVLREEGSLGKLLTNCERNDRETDDVRQFRNALRNQVDQIVYEYNYWVKTHPNHSYTQLLITAIDYARIDQRDFVLLLIIATVTGMNSLADDFFDRALASYIAKRGAYDSIFKNLIPTRLSDRADDEMSPSSRRRKAVAANGWLPFEKLCGVPGERQALAYVPTGLAKLDQAIMGWQGLTVIGGDRGTGKTSLMLWAAMYALYHDPELLIVFFSLDMSQTMLQRRLMCMEAGVDFRVLNDESRAPEVTDRLKAAHAKLCQELYPRLCIYEQSRIQAGVTTENLMGLQDWCRTQIGGTKRVMFMFDLFQRIPTPVNVPTVDADNYRLDMLQQVRAATRSQWQPEGAPIIAASEIRKVDRRILSHDDLLGTSRLSSDADTILLMWSKREIDGKECLVEPLNVRIDKGRDGVLRIDVPLWFTHNRCQFSDEPPPSAKNASRGQSRQKPSTNDIDPMAGA